MLFRKELASEGRESNDLVFDVVFEVSKFEKGGIMLYRGGPCYGK